MVVGAIVYYIVIALVIRMGLNTNDMKLISALVVAVFLAIPYWKSGLDQKNRRARSTGAEGTDPVWKRRSTHA